MTDERPRIAKTTEQKRAGAPPHTAHPAHPAHPAHAASVGTNGVAPAIPQPRPIPPLPTLPALPARVANAASVTSGHGHGGSSAHDTGIAPGTVSPTGTGQDARHRGWYWHWNTLITQYAPILGLKGVGLLNSYTVWTDRREGSPHQGYAFPAQESEARFYGEGREELITLNKVLVALDLMEIHKEMVVRQDERGRRWRVPHNFYRVKDPKEGLVLSLPAVVRVLELAQRDRNVFRQVRHIFGPQFTPIDRTSLWHSLLPELRALPLWIELEARATRERRAPRTGTAAGTATTRTDASTAATDATKQRSKGATIVDPHDIDASFLPPTDDNARELDTMLLSTIDTMTDNARMQQTIASDSDAALPFSRPPADEALRPTLVSRPIMEPSPLTIGSMNDEGMMNVEDGGDGSVTPADSMYYQSGETKEETTSTSSTSSRARVHERRRDTKPQTPEPHLTLPLSSPAPWRASVSDLFTALEAQRIHEPTDDTDADTTLTPSADEWELLMNAVIADVLPDAQGSAQPGSTPRASLGQPLPPEPGEPEEGLIVVRAVAVTDQPAIGTDERALLAEIESALAMTNGRPPSDMEMSLYWQIARDADAAARNQSGPGSGLGWVLAAITEAVYSSGTGRVAPKYVARICERWTLDGYMSDGRIAPVSGVSVPPPPPQWPLTAVTSPATPDRPDHPDHTTATGDDSPTSPSTPAADTVLTDADLARLWPAVVRRLEGILPTDSLQARWFTEARVLCVTGDRATVQAIDAETALKLTNYRGLISRRLSDVLGWPVEAVFQAAPTRPPDPDTSMSDTEPETDTDTDTDTAPDISPEVPSLSPQMSTQVHAIAPSETVAVPPPSPWSWPASSGTSSSPTLPAEVAPRSSAPLGSGPIPIMSPLTHDEARLAASASVSAPAPPKPARVVSREQPLEAASAPALLSVLSSSIPTFAVAGSEETNREIWPRVLMRLREGMTDVTFKVWMEPTALLAVDADGTLVVGARNRVQRERLERQHTADIAAALGALLGCTVCVRIAVIGE